METGFRQLTERERRIVEKLLETEFPGRYALREQIGSVTAKQIEEDGTLILRCASGPPSPTRHTLAVEGKCKDADGMIISVMLHVDKDGFMNMLEIYKYDMSPIINQPSADDLVLLVPGDRKRIPDR
jgi:hypothetical protein